MLSKSLKIVCKLLFVCALISAVLIPVASVKAEGSCPQSDPNCLVIGGSTTVYPVVQISETRFFPENPGTNYNVDGTQGSGWGQSYILSGQLDIGMSSSACSDANAGKNGAGAAIYTCAQLQDTVLGRDAVSIMVNNAKTCVTNITKAELQGIYEGTITNWNHFPGCSSATIKPYARIQGSGTRASLLKLASICATDDTSGGACITGGVVENTVIQNTTVTRLQGNPEMEAAIGNDPDGIGYVGLAFFDSRIKALGVDFGSGPISPSDATVANGTYPLSRVLHFFTAPSTSKALVATYLGWIVSPEAQAIVKDVGYVNIAKVAPDWDVNLDNRASIADIATIGNFWGLTSSVPGWVRADVNYDGRISIADVATVGNFWGQTWN